MDNLSFKIKYGFTNINNSFIDDYMIERPVYSMVYIYALRLAQNGKKCSNAIIAEKLNIFESDVVKAWEYWDKKGVIKLGKNEIEFLNIGTSSNNSLMAAENKFYNPSDVERLSESDKNIDGLIVTVEKLIGRTLSPNNINIIVNMYDKLGLSFEVIIMLIQFYSGKSLAYIEKVAISWAEKGINTVKLAEKELNSYNIYTKILRFFGVNSRSYTANEKKYMSVWLNEYNFSLDIIKIACERAVANTGKASFSYANKILSDWHNKGVKSPEDIEKLDTKKKGTPAAKVTPVKNIFNDYTQEVYTDEQIEEILRRKGNN